jgi:hypothetical protein
MISSSSTSDVAAAAATAGTSTAAAAAVISASLISQIPSERTSLTPCERCNAFGVGVVKPTGFCSHCERLAVMMPDASAAAISSASCDKCGAFGLGVVKPTGLCSHCERLEVMMPDASAAAISSASCDKCGAFGLGVVKASGLCSHCERQAGIPGTSTTWESSSAGFLFSCSGTCGGAFTLDRMAEHTRASEPLCHSCHVKALIQQSRIDDDE